MYLKKKEFLPGLHVLRGFAASSIVVFHFLCLSPNFSAGIFKGLILQFGTGVTLFFILSCFSLCHSTLNKLDNKNWLGGYITRRFFRIYPLFFLLLWFHLFWQFFSSTHTIHPLGEILLNITILFQYFPKYHESIVWAGWTIGIEVSFYCLFPILLSLSKKIKFWLLLFIISATVSFFVPAIIKDLNISGSYETLCFPTNLFIFISGGLIYFIHLRFKISRVKYASLILSLVCFLLWGAIVSNKMPINLYPILLIIKTMAFCSLVLYFCDKKIFYNKITKFLGEASYSIYLLHPIVIITLRPYLDYFYKPNVPVEISFIISFLIVFLTTCLIAFFINKYFETPIYKFGVRRAVQIEN